MAVCEERRRGGGGERGGERGGEKGDFSDGPARSAAAVRPPRASASTRCSGVLACLLVAGSFAMTFGQQESAPYVQGSWSITYKVSPSLLQEFTPEHRTTDARKTESIGTKTSPTRAADRELPAAAHFCLDEVAPRVEATLPCMEVMFPYQYTWSFDICMAESNNPDNFYQAQIAGSDPSTMRTQRIVALTPQLALTLKGSDCR
eukprot:1081378-Rhodomonas_salina.1